MNKSVIQINCFNENGNWSAIVANPNGLSKEAVRHIENAVKIAISGVEFGECGGYSNAAEEY